MSSAVKSQAGGPPPLPPKGPRSNLDKVLPPTPPRGAQAPVAGLGSMKIEDKKAQSNLVTIELKASSTITINVDRGTSLQCLCDVAASNSDFKLKPGAFDLWFQDKKGKLGHCIKNEDVMRKLWTDKCSEDHLTFLCKARK